MPGFPIFSVNLIINTPESEFVVTNLSRDVVLNLAEAAVNKNCGKQATARKIFLVNLGLPPLFYHFFFLGTDSILLSGVGDLSNYQFVVKNSLIFLFGDKFFFYIKTRQ